MGAVGKYGLAVMSRTLASSELMPVTTPRRSPMIYVRIDDREVHGLLLANLAWHHQCDGKEHGATTPYNGDQSTEIPIAKRHCKLLKLTADRVATGPRRWLAHQFNDCSGSVEQGQAKLVPRARRSLPLAEHDQVAYPEGSGTRLAHAGGGNAELGHTAEATRAEGHAFARLQDVGFLGCRRTKPIRERGSLTKKMNK